MAPSRCSTEIRDCNQKQKNGKKWCCRERGGRSVDQGLEHSRNKETSSTDSKKFVFYQSSEIQKWRWASFHFTGSKAQDLFRSVHLNEKKKERNLVIRWQVAEEKWVQIFCTVRRKYLSWRYQKTAAFSDSYFPFSAYRPRWVHMNVVSKLQQQVQEKYLYIKHMSVTVRSYIIPLGVKDNICLVFFLSLWCITAVKQQKQNQIARQLLWNMNGLQAKWYGVEQDPHG